MDHTTCMLIHIISCNHFFSIIRAWVSIKDLLPFKKYQEKFRMNSHRHRLSLSEAIWEAEEDPELTLSDACSILKKLEKTGKKVHSFSCI